MKPGKGMRFRLFVAVAIAGLVVSAFLAVKVYRNHVRHQRLLVLYYEASGVLPYFHNYDDAARAVHTIGTYGDDEATRILLTLASNEPETPGLNLQPLAIKELIKRPVPQIAEEIAGLVQVKRTFDTRMAAAEALEAISCNRPCTIMLLEYLNEIHQGKLNREDEALKRYDSDSELDRWARDSNKAQQEKTYSVLYRVLIRDSQNTNAVLSSAYGLGGSNPQEFALDFVVRSKDTASCPALEASARMLDEVSDFEHEVLARRVRSAVIALGCHRTVATVPRQSTP
jgi:hypothetical protein